jgi:hypothetical protein
MTPRLRAARLKHAWVLGIVAFVYVAIVAPAALQSMVLVASKVWFGAIMGYWIDRATFDYARPDPDNIRDTWMFRRVAIQAAAILALALGV